MCFDGPPRTETIGRVAVVVDDHPEIFPVNYAVDERGHHPEHAAGVLGVGEDVAVPHPRAGLRGMDEHGVALARGHRDGVFLRRVGERIAVLGDHQLRHAVQVHRMDLRPLVQVVHDDPVALLGDERRRCRE